MYKGHKFQAHHDDWQEVVDVLEEYGHNGYSVAELILKNLLFSIGKDQQNLKLVEELNRIVSSRPL